MNHCIWCKQKSSNLSVEHIIPEALGCPTGFEFTHGEVCTKCNTGLAHLDQAVIDDFDILTFIWGIPRKKGKSPIISNRGNLIGYSKLLEKCIQINMEKYPVMDANGKIIHPYGKSKRNIKANFINTGKQGKISFNTKIGENLKFTRGIIKIAFSSFAYFFSVSLALDNIFDGIRDFVIHGKGERKILLMNSIDSDYKNQVQPPLKRLSDEYLIQMRLACVEIIVDLSPNMSIMPELEKILLKTHGKEGWTIIPN